MPESSGWDPFGLPLAVEFADAGLHTTGIDLDERKVACITGGSSYIPDVPDAEVASSAPPARWMRRQTFQ